MIITSFLIFSLLLYLPEANGNQDAKRLYEDLFQSYNILVRPVENSSDFITVKLSLKLAKIVELVCIFVVLNFSMSRIPFTTTYFGSNCHQLF